jgi:hypothetical protein
MKKILTAILALIAIPSLAQLNGDGYYRIQNNITERYVTITDDVVASISTPSDIDANNLTTWKGFDNVKSNPGSIFLIEAVGEKYNISGQGVSVHKITGGKAYVSINKRAEGIYQLCASASQGGISVTKYLYDATSDDEYDYVRTDGNSAYQYWHIKPVDEADNYIGITPTIETNDGWYGTIYASFPFKLASSGMTAYYVDGVDTGQFQLKEITDEVKPAATPMIIKCSSNDAAQNKITPVISTTTAPSDNLLGGTYFASSLTKHIARVEYDSNKMRVLGKDTNGDLIFTKATEAYLTKKKYIPKNTAWLNVPAGLTGDFKLVDRESFTGISNIEMSCQKNAQKGTYTLTGVQVDDTKALRPGIYIKNRKKIIIK